MQTNAELFEAMAVIAAPVMQAYKDDFLTHDRKVIDGLKPGDSLLWAPRECGSHLIITRRENRPNKRAMEHFDVIGEQLKWFLVTVTEERIYLSPCSNPYAVVNAAEIDSRNKAGTVSELHM